MRDKNREALKALERAVIAGEPCGDARYFVWGDSLHFGTAKMEPGSLSGPFVTLVDSGLPDRSDTAQRKLLVRMAKVLNAASEMRAALIWAHNELTRNGFICDGECDICKALDTEPVGEGQ